VSGLNFYLSSSSLFQEELPVSLDLFSLMLDPLLPPAGLAEPNRGREKVVSKRCLRDIGRDYGLCRLSR
jgi:hypothetical protein